MYDFGSPHVVVVVGVEFENRIESGFHHSLVDLRFDWGDTSVDNGCGVDAAVAVAVVAFVDVAVAAADDCTQIVVTNAVGVVEVAFGVLSMGRFENFEERPRAALVSHSYCQCYFCYY